MKKNLKTIMKYVFMLNTFLALLICELVWLSPNFENLHYTNFGIMLTITVSINLIFMLIYPYVYDEKPK